ncbi:MAG: acyl-CoA dehydratase activase [Chloroflexi bacterium]|nr:acyl-CoA dehydratase activase [Chloroflexota bacterium]MCL5952627.1 acyl-CoA dehydratase activase [Chloroflexota bacterium]
MYTAGIDVGSTYTKSVIFSDEGRVVGRAMVNTGFRLGDAALRSYRQAIAQAGLPEHLVSYIVSTGYGRYQVPFRDIQVTDLSAQARGATFFFPNTKTVLDVGGQTMKASRLDNGRVRSFRLNDKCAAGTGAFLEKTARYMNYKIEEIGPLVATSKEPVTISSVCAVFAESEVINHVSAGATPADIMHGAMVSLVDRSVQLMKRVQMEPEFTVVGGILRFETMVRVVSDHLNSPVNVPPGDLVQYTAAVGAAIMGQQRLKKLREAGALKQAA